MEVKVDILYLVIQSQNLQIFTLQKGIAFSLHLFRGKEKNVKADETGHIRIVLTSRALTHVVTETRLIVRQKKPQDEIGLIYNSSLGPAQIMQTCYSVSFTMWLSSIST